MAKTREELKQTLRQILGSSNTYFNPPTSILMKYPAIRYHLEGEQVSYGSNKRYCFLNRYVLTVIDTDPDSKIYLKILESLPYCSYDRRYFSDNLCHDVLTLYW